MYFTKFQDFDPKGKSKTCKNASFDCHLNFNTSCLFMQHDRQEPISPVVIYFTIVCQMNIMRTDKITKRFTVNANLVSLSITRHSKK